MGKTTRLAHAWIDETTCSSSTKKWNEKRQEARDGRTKSKEARSYDRHNPVCMVFRRPAVEEQASGQEHCTDRQHREADLWLDDASSRADLLLDGPVADDSSEREAQNRADAEAKIDQADNVTREAIVILKDVSYGGEEEVHIPVDEHHVNGEDKHNGREGQHLERTRDIALDMFPGG